MVFTIASFSSKILVFLMVPLYTAVLSTEEYGVSDMVNTIATLMQPVLSLSIAHAVLRFCFIKDFQNEDVYTIGHRIIVIGGVVSVLLTAALYFLNVLPQLGWYIWFVPAHFFLHAYVLCLSYYARGISDVKISAVSGVASSFTIVASNLLFLLVFKWGILGYMISYLLGPAVGILVIWCKLSAGKLIKNEVNDNLRRQMLKYSAPLIPNSLSWWALSSFSRFFIMLTLGVSTVGIYSASEKIPAILTVLSDIFAQAWMLSALNGYGTEETTRFIRAIHKKLFSLLIVLTGGFIITVKPLASILLSGDFSSCWYLIPYLLISVLMGAMIGFYGSIFSAERKNKMQFISTLVGALVSVMILVVFLKRYGIIVAAISNMIGYFVIWLMRKEGIKKYIDIKSSTFVCLIQLLLLLVESILVSLSLWWPAAIVLVIVISINAKELWNSLDSIKDIVIGVVKKPKK